MLTDFQNSFTDRLSRKKQSDNKIFHHTCCRPVSQFNLKLECGPMPIMMATLPNIGGALCSTPQSLADADYYSVVQ